MKRITLLVTLLSIIGPALSQERIIAVEGSAVIEAVPDIIRLSYSVSNLHNDDPSKAKTKVDEISTRSVHSLLELGIQEQDITSSSLRVEMVEDYDHNDNASVIGHAVSRDVDIVIRDIDQYGQVIQALVDAQVSQITNVEPDVSNYDELQRMALGKAAQSAKENASFLAEQFDAEIDKVHQIGKQNIRRQFSLEEIVVTAAKRGQDPESTLHEFKPGTVKVSSNVYVEFQLR